MEADVKNFFFFFQEECKIQLCFSPYFLENSFSAQVHFIQFVTTCMIQKVIWKFRDFQTFLPLLAYHLLAPQPHQSPPPPPSSCLLCNPTFMGKYKTWTPGPGTSSVDLIHGLGLIGPTIFTTPKANSNQRL